MSIKAIGNPTIGVGVTRTYDLDEYFNDPDGDTLAYATTGIDTAVATVDQPGSELFITGVARGDVTMLVTATDQYLTTSQQVHVRVPANRRPIRTRHVEPVALAISGNPILRAVTDSFSDPDGGVLNWLFQWEEGDVRHQYRQEVWNVYRTQGSNLLYCNSHFQYPPGSNAPWGSGQAWIMPANVDVALRTALSTATAMAHTYRFKTRSAATARWDSTARRVYLDVRTSTALPTSSSITLAPPSRVMLGEFADVAWVEGDQQAPMNFLPGSSTGSRTGYVRVWDAGIPPLDASDLFQVALGVAPVVQIINDMSIFAGTTHTIRLTEHFHDPDGDSLAYKFTESASNIVQVVLVGSELRIYGLLVGYVDINVTATDPIGLVSSFTFTVTVTASAASERTPLITPYRAEQLIERRGEDVEMTFDDRTVIVKAIVTASPVLQQSRGNFPDLGGILFERLHSSNCR